MAGKRDRKGSGPKASRQKGGTGAQLMPKGIRRHLRRLESMLSAAARKEALRVRKLAKAHLRRQRIEAEIEEIRLTTAPLPKKPEAAPAQSPATPEAPAAPVAPSRPRRARTTKPAKA
jgi:hypothetical protein